jgi:predicted small lipoprotein YifL
VPARVICLFCLTFLALALAGCGRAGPLLPPPGTPPNEPTASVITTSPMTGAINNTGSGPPAPTASNANPPSKGPPFFLDPLVK